MRLSKKEIEIIKSKIGDFFPNNEIYIFGSTLDNQERGGDIDIFIRNSFIEDIRKRRKIAFQIKIELENLLFKPIDILLSKDENRDIEQEALKGVKI